MSNDILRTVNLHGALDVYGESHELAFNTFIELASFIDSNVGEIDGKTYSQFVTDKNFQVIVTGADGVEDVLSKETAVMSLTDNDLVIDIVPVLEGAKSQRDAGAFQFIGGGILAIAGTVTGNPLLIQAGIGLTLNGVSTLLAPVPNDLVAEVGSSIYNGAVNQTRTGVAIPLVVGDTITSSLQASFGIDVVQWENDEEAD